MHRIHYTLRAIAQDDLPKIQDMITGEERVASTAELLNMGIVSVADGIYSCAEQVRQDPETETWASLGPALLGQLLAHGDQRYDRLPEDVRGRVLRARVIADVTGESSALDLAVANVVEQTAAIEEYVGEGFTVELSVEEEAARLAAMPGNTIERITIPMADVDEDAHVVEATDLAPQAWAGERIRRNP